MCSRSAFTLVELMIAVSIIGLLTVLAIPAIMKARMRTQDTSFVNDLRVLTDSVLEQYAINRGDYPPEAEPGVEPAGVVDYMPRHLRWTDETAIGGVWDWDRAADHGTNIHGVYAGLSVVNPRRTSLQMAEIDARIDDGNPTTGRFRGRDGGYIYVLQ